MRKRSNRRYWTEKCCPSCGKYFIDYSVNACKVACSKECYKEFVNAYEDPNKNFDRKMYLRLGVFRRMGIIFSNIEIETITESLRRGICQICGNQQPMDKLCIDHDHATGKYRGVICSRCNFTLGMVRDDANMLSTLSGYLDR